MLRPCLLPPLRDHRPRSRPHRRARPPGARGRLPDRDALRRSAPSPTPGWTPGPPSGWAPPGPSGSARWPPTPASRRSSVAPTHAAETFHIGRRHVRDAAGDPVVIDWRAPMSRPFYQASAADPQGLIRRRRFGFAGGELTGYEDELLAAGDDHESRFLREEIERPAQRPDARHRRHHPARPGRHRPGPADRVDLRPGRAGHRQDRGRPAPRGLPALHARRPAGPLRRPRRRARTGRSSATSSRCCPPSARSTSTRRRSPSSPPGCRSARWTAPHVAVLKGDARMAEVLRRALWGEIAKPADSIQVPLTGRRYRIPVERLKRYVDDLRRRGRADDDQQLLHYAAGRERLAMLLAEDARRQKEEAGGSPTDAETAARRPQRRGPRLLRRGLAGARRRRARARPVDRPRPAGPGGPRPAGRRRAGAAALGAAPRSVRTAPWTEADAVLVDEVAGLLERTEGYGHVVLDEAQDLSPDAVPRRRPAGWPPARSPCSATSRRRPARGRRRTGRRRWPGSAGRAPSSGRSPAATACPARCSTTPTGCCRSSRPDLPPATAVRSEPGSLTRPAGDGARRPAGRGRRASSPRPPARSGSSAPTPPWPRWSALLTAAGVPAAALTDDGDAAARVAVVPATLAKGLEFDAVVVVDPAAIVAAEPRGPAPALRRPHPGGQHPRRPPSRRPPGAPGALSRRTWPDRGPSRCVTGRPRTARGIVARAFSVEVRPASEGRAMSRARGVSARCHARPHRRARRRPPGRAPAAVGRRAGGGRAAVDAACSATRRSS